jgi:hypothetical protein
MFFIFILLKTLVHLNETLFFICLNLNVRQIFFKKLKPVLMFGL